MLVGPPDPVSNIRPVIYDDVDGVAQQAGRTRRGRRKEGSEDAEGQANTSGRSEKGKEGTTVYTRHSPTHPYSLDEFSGDPSSYQWRVEQSRLDAYNHAFWKDVSRIISS